MILAVTGATGFLGRRVVAAAAGAGHEVRALVREGAAIPAALAAPGVAVVRGDLRDSCDESAGLLDGADAFIHLAALGVQSRDRDWAHALDVNVVGSLRWLRRARERGVTRAVVAGTCMEYSGHGRLPDAPVPPGDPAPLCDEDSPLETSSAYSATKAAGGLLVRAWAREAGVRLWYLRLASLYGLGDDPAKLLPSAARTAQAGETLEMTAGEQVREWLYVGDAAAAVLQAAGRPCPAGVAAINVGTGLGVTLREVVTRLTALTGRDPRSGGAGRRPYRPGEVHHLVMDVRRAREALGWTARVGLDEGLRELVHP